MEWIWIMVGIGAAIPTFGSDDDAPKVNGGATVKTLSAMFLADVERNWAYA
jgi:hypothetical protein